jgi:lipoate---protein ligase
MSPPRPLPAWRVTPVEVADPGPLLDRGLALLDGLQADPSPVLRWYRSTRTAVVLGRGQRLDAASTPEVEVLTRHSGGGAVLLDPTLLSLDVVLPPDHPWLAGDLAAVFGHVGRAWRRALTDLGVAGLVVHAGAGTARRRGTAREQLLAAVCYATPGRGEVLHTGRKLVGLAQRRRRHGALVQCGLLRRWDPAPLLRALGADPDDPEIAAAAVGLEDLGYGDLDEAAIVPAVSAALADG